jgi:hypothetical protein
MAKTRPVTLGGTELHVPMLPIRLNKIAYPLCRKLHNSGFLDRIIEGKGQVDCSDEEMDILVEIAFTAVQAAAPQVTRDEFDNWAISPPELVDAYFVIRYQTGAWVAPEPEAEVSEEAALGEAEEVETLPT